MENFSWTIFLSLIAVVISSSLVLWALIRRSTTLKKWVELCDWASDNGMKAYSAEKAELPRWLQILTDPPPVPTLSVVGQKLTVVQFQTGREQRTADGQGTRWHALLRKIDMSWPPTALRPRVNGSSLVDLLPVSSFPSLAPPDRFVVFGTDSASARRLAKCSIINLLPPDVGFILIGDQLVLDFSTRPLDTIELPRLITIAEQALAHLPLPPEDYMAQGKGASNEADNQEEDVESA